MAAIRLKHRLLNKEMIMVTAIPGDGRYPEEFRLPRAEARRFAWALLADLDPKAAAEAAAEEGLTLAQVTGPVVVLDERRRNAPTPGRGLSPASKKYRVLQAIAAGAATTQDIGPLVPDAANVGSLCYELCQDQYLARMDRRAQGMRTAFSLTAAAEQLLGLDAERRVG